MTRLESTVWIVAAGIAVACSSKKQIDWDEAPSSSAGGAAGESGEASGPHVRIVSPKAGDTLAGSAEMKMDLVLPQEVALVELGINDEWVALEGSSSSIPFNTSGAENGTMTLGYRITADDGSVFEDSVEVEVDNPEFRLESYALGSTIYSNGETVSIDLTYSERAVTTLAALCMMPMSDFISVRI